MRKILILLLCSFSVVTAQEEGIVNLRDCIKMAVDQHPLSGQQKMHERSYSLAQKNIAANWLPQLHLNAQATYQSDVPAIGDVGIPMPASQPGAPTSMDINIPKPEKDQYKVNLEINQTIYDGGASRKSKALEKNKLQVDKQQTQVQINKVKQTVADVYFSILLLDKQKAILQLTKSEIGMRKETIHSGIEHGTVLRSDLESLEAEILKLDQQLLEVQQNRRTMICVLEELTDTVLNDSMRYKSPKVNYTATDSLTRPELALFDYQSASLKASGELIRTQCYPKLYAFSQAGYGKPGLNMLSDEWDTYYLVGAGFKWNLWDWKKNKRERQLMEVQQSIIETQKKEFVREIGIALKKQKDRIDNLEALIKSDKKIIKARERVTISARSQLNNGVINATEYIAILNKEKQASLNFEKHKLELIRAKVHYMLIKGYI